MGCRSHSLERVNEMVNSLERFAVLVLFCFFGCVFVFGAVRGLCEI